mgnify:CR=1 FL=1
MRAARRPGAGAAAEQPELVPAGRNCTSGEGRAGSGEVASSSQGGEEAGPKARWRLLSLLFVDPGVREVRRGRGQPRAPLKVNACYLNWGLKN